MDKTIAVDLEDIIGLDLEGFLELLEDRCGGEVLEDIEYKVVGADRGSILIRVIANEAAV